MKHRWPVPVCAAILVGAVLPTLLTPQTQTAQARGLYARIAMMRARDEGHSVDLEAGYIRHLEWHRQAKDTFNWYSYSVWASTERQRWILYATFGHTAAELSNPVSPAEDERDSIINILPHVQFLGNAVYEFLPTLSRSNGVPTATLRAEYTTVELNYGTGKAFEAALAAEQSKPQGETLWYRLVEGGNAPCYLRLRPRASLASILDERAETFSINYRDLLVAKGVGRWKPPLGRIPLSDGVGIVAAKGRAVSRLKVGDRVAPIFYPKWLEGRVAAEKMEHALGGATADGVLAECTLFEEASLVHVPAHLSDEEAATLPCAA